MKADVAIPGGVYMVEDVIKSLIDGAKVAILKCLACSIGRSGLRPEHTIVDHIAFTIALGDFDSEKRRLESLGLEVEVENHDWVKWRSLYFHDPEGNQVELVCYDESLGQ